MLCVRGVQPRDSTVLSVCRRKGTSEAPYTWRMESSLHFLVGQAAIALGVYLLSKSITWTAAVGLWLVVEGVVVVLWAVLSEPADTTETRWHEGHNDT